MSRHTVLFTDQFTIDGRRLEDLSVPKDKPLPVTIQPHTGHIGHDGAVLYGQMSNFDWEGNRLTAEFSPGIPDDVVVSADVSVGGAEVTHFHGEAIIIGGELRGACLVKPSQWVWKEGFK